VDRPICYSELPDVARTLLDGIKKLAQSYVGNPVELLGVNVRDKRIWQLVDGKRFRYPQFLSRGTHLVMNAGVLLSDRPGILELIREAEAKKTVFCGAKSTKDTHALAYNVSLDATVANILWVVLTHLTACVDDDVSHAWKDIVDLPFLPPNASFVENSPAMGGLTDVWCGRWFNSPRFLNTALKEIVTNSKDYRTVGKDPQQMSIALLSQREISNVPWIFNTLINEIDYRTGSVHPLSIPPEIHLSLTGACNIECRFCGYTHDIARRDFVTVSDVSHLNFLSNAQTLRLSAGLGEPTLNKNLPSIIKYISSNFPHLSINFFTNALNIHHNGLIDIMVGNVRWINVSINASNPNSWQTQCKTDQFDIVCNNLKALLREKRSRRSLWPIVHASMVLNKLNISDLPRMPALCRELGVDYFTAFPYFALVHNDTGKFGPEMALESCRAQYDAIYWETIQEAKNCCVSIELPPPRDNIKIVLGLEARPMHDFAAIASNEWPFGRFLTELDFGNNPDEYCHFLWRNASIGSTYNVGHARDQTHFLYPCVGPLTLVDLSRRTAFGFPDLKGFYKLWQNPVFTHLRKAQHESGVCRVCDLCRQTNTRDPSVFKSLERMVGEFAAIHG